MQQTESTFLQFLSGNDMKEIFILVWVFKSWENLNEMVVIFVMNVDLE